MNFSKYFYLSLFLAVCVCYSLPIASAEPNFEVVAAAVKFVANEEVISLQKSAIPHLYEIQTKSSIYYTDELGSYVLFGAKVFSTINKKDYTRIRNEELANFQFTDLPVNDAIKTVTGDGRNILVSFEDPNCGYCKKLARTVEMLENTTHFIFLVDILEKDSYVKASSIFCSKNAGEVWNDWMIRNKKIPEITKCDSPVSRNRELMAKYRLTGTPAIFFRDGSRLYGASSLAAIQSMFDKQKNR